MRAPAMGSESGPVTRPRMISVDCWANAGRGRRTHAVAARSAKRRMFTMKRTNLAREKLPQFQASYIKSGRGWLKINDLRSAALEIGCSASRPRSQAAKIARSSLDIAHDPSDAHSPPMRLLRFYPGLVG